MVEMGERSFEEMNLETSGIAYKAVADEIEIAKLRKVDLEGARKEALEELLSSARTGGLGGANGTTPTAELQRDYDQCTEELKAEAEVFQALKAQLMSLGARRRDERVAMAESRELEAAAVEVVTARLAGLEANPAGGGEPRKTRRERRRANKPNPRGPCTLHRSHRRLATTWGNPVITKSFRWEGGPRG